MLIISSTNPSNLTTSAVSPWVPGDFEIRAIIKHGQQAMSLIGMYMNAIHTMYDLCYMEQTANIPRRLWSLPDYDITVDISATEARYAIWGLQGTADADAEAGLWPLISQVTLGGATQGHVSIRLRSQPFGNLPPMSGGANTSAVSVQSVTATPPLDTVSDLGSEMDVHQTYNGIGLTPQYVFSMCLRVMSFGSQYGRDTPASGMNFDDRFVLSSEFDARGQPQLKYRHVFKLMRVMANTMVRNSQFGELDVELWKYGKRIAWGWLKAGEGLR